MGTRKSTATKARILEASVEEFIASGVSGFTMQGVANRAAISVGNLTYHYQFRHTLLEEMIAYWMDECRKRFDQLFSSAKNSGETDPVILIEWLIELAQKKDFSRVIAELRAMANHDQRVSELVHTLYDDLADRILTEFSDGQPSLRHSELRRILLLFSTLMAGSSVLLGNRPEYHLHRNEIKEITCKTIVPLLAANSTEKRSKSPRFQ